MSKGRFFVKPILAAAALCSGMFFLGCEIGLGPAVDTEAPRLSIESPKVNEAVADTFELKGKCWDDTMVSHVDIVKISSNDDASIVYSNLGRVNVNGEEWNIQLHYEGNGIYDVNGRKIPLKDGTWIVEMVAYDENRDGVPVARSFDIDNTPPVFLVSSPSSLDNDLGIEYGRTVKISGTIADAHSIDTMQIRVYDKDFNEITDTLAKTEFTDIDKSNTEVVIASYSTSENLTTEEQRLQKNYMALFGRTDDRFDDESNAGTKIINLSIRLKDKADNWSDYTYISSNLNRLLRAETSIGEGSSLDAGDYMNIKAGTYSNGVLDAVGAQKIKDALDFTNPEYNSSYKYISYNNESGRSLLSFRVDPNNSPTYHIGGYEISKIALADRSDPSKWGKTTNQAQLAIELTSGKDKVPISPSKLSAKIYRAESDGSLVMDDGHLVVNYDGDTENPNRGLFTAEGGTPVFDINSAVDRGIYYLTFPANTMSSGGGYYLIVNGEDENGNELVPREGGYCFSIFASGTAPYLTSQKNEKCVGLEDFNNDRTFPIQYNDIDGNVMLHPIDDAITYTAKIYDGHYTSATQAAGASLVSEKAVTAIRTQDLTQITATQYSVNLTLMSGTLPADKNYTCVVEARARNSENRNGEIKYTFLYYIDGKKPVITLNNESELNGKKVNRSSIYVKQESENGNTVYKYELRGTVSDENGSGVSEIKLKFDDEEPVSPENIPEVTSPAAVWTYTRTFAPGSDGTHNISIKVKDKANNDSGWIEYPDIVIDFTPPTIGMEYVKYTDSEGPKTVERPENLNTYYTSDIEIKFKGYDAGGSGINSNSTSIAVSKKEGDNWVTPAQSTSTWGQTGNERKIYGDGVWKFVATVEDNSGQRSPELVLTTTIDKTAPSIGTLSVMENPSGNGYYTNGTLQIKIPYTETGSGLASASYRIECSDGSNVLSEGVAVSGQGENEELIITTSGFKSEDGGINTLHVTLTDKAGNQREASPLTVKIDRGEPKLGVKWYNMSIGGTADGSSLSSYPETIYYTGTSEHLLYGTVSDEGGIEKLEFSAGGTYVNPTELLFSTDTVDLGDSDSFADAEWKTWNEVKDSSYNISAWRARFKNPGANGRLTVKATDRAGLETSVSDFVNLQGDNEGPTINVLNLHDGDTVVDSKIIDEKFTLRGKWSDNDGSGTKILKWSMDGTNYTDNGVDSSESHSESPWTIEIPRTSMPEGTGNKIYLKAWDELGNESEVKTISSLVYDYTAPTLTIYSPANPKEYYNASDNPLEIVFKSTDNIAVDKIELVKVERNGSEVSIESPVGYTFTPNAGKTSSETAKITIPCNGNSDGKWSFKLRAKDSSELYSEIVSLSTTVDSEMPSIDLTNATVEGKAPDGWYCGNIIKVEAKALDTGAGLSKILYKVIRSNAASIPENLDSTAGSVSVSGTNTQFNVMASVTEESTLSPEVHNILLMQAFDLAGNKSGLVQLPLKIDHASPTASAEFYRHDKNDSSAVKIEGTVMTNGAQGLIIYGSISDNLSGADRVVPIGADGKEIAGAELYYSTLELPTSAGGFGTAFENSLKPKNELGDGEIKSFKIKIPKSKLESGNISATLWDLAGNSAKIRMLDIEKDSENPEINLRFPATIEVGQSGTATKVNGKITIDGTASDNSTLASVKLEKSVDGVWTEIKTLTGIGAYNWSSGELEMTKVSGDSIIMFSGSPFNGSSEDVLIRATAEDAAGNRASKTFRYTADPESDRPEIRINNIVLKNERGMMSETVAAWLQSKTIYGSISDDDGSVQKFEYRYGDDTDWSEITVSGGTWTLDVNTDGPRSVYFRVTDAAGSKFTSGAAATSPKLTDGTNEPEISYLHLNVDTKNPDVGELYYQVKKSGESEWGEKKKDIAKGLFGGDYEYLRFYLHAEDANGISDVKFKVDGKGPNDGYAFDSSASNLEDGDYYSESIDLDGYESNTYTINAIVMDNAKKETEKSARFNVDNDAPEITIHSPDIVVSASSMSGEIDELSTLYFALTKNEQNPSATAEKLNAGDIYTTTSGGKWMPINGPWATFNVVFDGNPTTPTVTHALILKEYFSGLGMNVSEDDEYAYIYFHVMAVDPCGNTSIETEQIQIDPWGDKPTVSISNPKSGNTLGGEINVSGTAMDLIGTPAGVKAVGLMMDVNGDKHWTREDMLFINQKHPDYTWCTFDSHGKIYQTVNINTILEDETLDEASVAKKYALVADLDGNGWSFTMNRSREFDPGTGEKARNVTVWAFAIDEDFNTSAIDVTAASQKMKNVSFKIDSDAPQIANKKLVRQDNSDVVMNYEAQMAVKGAWYFVADIFDNNNVSTITVDGTAVVENCEPTNNSPDNMTVTVEPLDADYISSNPNIPNTASGFKLKMTVGTNAPGTVFEERHEITFTENKSVNATTIPDSVLINIDNKAPVLVKSGTGYNIREYESVNKAKIADYNGFYTFGAVAKEDTQKVNGVEINQTGVARVAFYITRDIGTGSDNGTSVYKRLYDPMIRKGQSGNFLADYADAGTTHQEDGLYWIKGTVSGDVSNSENVRIGSMSTNIHKGGLVKINGVIHRIADVTSSTKTIKLGSDGNPDAVTVASGTEIYFALANVVDNPIQEGDGAGSVEDDGYWATPVFDDGDRMVETFVTTGTSCSWSANIVTKNIGDGKATLHYVVFDKAGNYDSAEVPIFIGNNLPRISGLTFSTDDNDDGKFTGDEIHSYKGLYGVDGVNSAMFPKNSTNENPVSIATVRNKIQIVPEVVGGNGALSYTLNVYRRNNADNGWSTTKTGSVALTALGKNGTETAQDIAIDMSVAQIKSAGIQDGNNEKFKVTIEDSTPGEKMETDLSLILNIALDDSTPPVIRIRPFYWNSANDNSLFENSTANGHIELPSDLPDSFTVGATDNEMDRQPKVSGKIRIEGVAWDDAMIKKINLKIHGGAAQTIATYNKGWKYPATLPTGISDVSITRATYRELLDSGILPDVEIPEDESENSLVKEISQRYGHVVKWSAVVDTETVFGSVTCTDRNISSEAVDRGSPDDSGAYPANGTPSVASSSQSGGVDGSGDMTNYYTMDVVPYVSKVYTNLAKSKISNWSVYNRTALGHYPVQSVVSNVDSSIKLKTKTSDDVVLYGFNINDSSAKIVSGGNTFTVGNSTAALKIDAGTAGQLKFNVAKLASGKLNLTVKGLSVLNNINDNDAKGGAAETGNAYGNCYNRQANGDTNNVLTDDIEFDVWEFNDRASEPLNGLMTGINMEVNQATGMLNYAATNGGLYYNMGGKVGETYYSSYYWAADWDTFAGPCVGFHVDDLGNTYSVCSGGDTNSSGDVDKYAFWTSRWGLGSHGTGGTYGGSNALRLEHVALKTGSNNLNYSLMKYRFLSSEFASTVSGESTNLYLVYYDALCNQIRFRAGTFSGNTRTNSGGFFDEATATTPSYYGSSNCQVIANGSEGTTFKTSDSENTTVAGISGRGAGQYVDVAVVKNDAGKDVVCVVWFDSEDNKLKFSYITDPIANWDSLKGDSTAASWSSPQTIFDEGGEYCHIASDKNNHLHIAAYAGNGDVMYAYLDKYTSNASTCTVDASGTVGEHLTLDVAVNSKGHSIPYIGYYTSAIKKPKYAYLVDKTVDNPSATFVQVVDGVDKNERFTGAWEVTVVPSPNRMTTNREDKVNVGVWKSSGVLTNSKVDGTVMNSSIKNTLNGYDSENWSKTYGNGTSNGVLGYQISTSSGSCLETAQMR